MKKYFLLPLLVYYLVSNVQAQEKIKLSSPNGEIKVSVRLTDKIYYDVACNDEVLLKDNYLQLKLKDKILGRTSQTVRTKTEQNKRNLNPCRSTEIFNDQ